MTISSAAAPDLDAVCRALLGREAVSAERIALGRNSRVFRVRLAGHADVVVKCYRRDPDDTRDRLATEFGGLQFLWQNGVRAIPCPIAADRERCCAIYEFIAGETPDGRSATASEIDASVRFLADLKALRVKPESAGLPAASEACFSLRALTAHVAARLDRLRRRGVGDPDDDRRGLDGWLDGTFEPLMREVTDWSVATAARARVAFEEEVSVSERTLSPSDFGFHNAIRRPDGSLAFVDFEYFGWDDPAKTVADFVLHPGMALPDAMSARFVARFLDAFRDVPGLADRAHVVYPLFGLKWCLILLNASLPERHAPASAAAAAGSHGETRAAQLARADAMAARIRRDYRDNPFLPHTGCPR